MVGEGVLVGDWPLIGRAEELRCIRALGGRSEQSAGVVLAGAAGVGKTRLAHEALADAERRGAVTRWAVATASARTLPLGAFAGLFGTAGADPARLMARAAEVLLRGAARAGAVVAVDDAHLLDDVSATLLHHLAIGRAATVVLTLRSGESAPDAVTGLWKDGHLRRLEVQPLSREETAELLEVALAGPAHSASVQALWSITQGNPLYLRQLLDGELEAGRLTHVAGVWRWSGQPELTPGLIELVEARIGGLGDDQREVVEVLAFAEPMGVPVLTRLTTAGAVERVEARGLIGVFPDGRRLQCRLAHPLYGEVQRARIGRLRARRLRGRIVTALAETGGRRRDDTLRRATLALDADLAPDPDLLNAAAHDAAALVNLPLAEQLARAAVTAGGGFESRLTLANALVGMAGTADVELAALTEHARTDAERVRAAVLRVSSLAWLQDRPSEAETVLNAAESAVEDGDAQAELGTLRALFDMFLGRPSQAAEAATGALASPRLPDQAVAMACVGLVGAFGALGRADEIAPEVARGRVAAVRSQDAAWWMFPLVAQQVMALYLAGYLREVAAIVDNLGEPFSSQAFALEVTSVLKGFAALGLGQVDSALRWLREAHAGLQDFGSAGGWLFACLIELARALAISGDTVAARQATAELDAVPQAGFGFIRPEMMLSRAWVVAAEGAVSEAIAMARDAAAAAAEAGQRAHEVIALQTAARFGDRAVAGRLAELAAEVDGPRASAAAAHAAALAAGDAAALQGVSAQLEAMGDLLSAADAAAQAAALFARQGRRGSAHAAQARADRLAQTCGRARTPAVAALGLLPLTAREREIVSLAAEGLSNREIAERLVVSVRTVEGHLYRASAKLGTTNRAELAALLRGN